MHPKSQIYAHFWQTEDKNNGLLFFWKQYNAAILLVHGYFTSGYRLNYISVSITYSFIHSSIHVHFMVYVHFPFVVLSLITLSSMVCSAGEFELELNRGWKQHTNKIIINPSYSSVHRLKNSSCMSCNNWFSWARSFGCMFFAHKNLSMNCWSIWIPLHTFIIIPCVLYTIVKNRNIIIPYTHIYTYLPKQQLGSFTVDFFF